MWEVILTVDKEDDSLLLRETLRLSDICVQASDDFFAPLGFSILDLACFVSVLYCMSHIKRGRDLPERQQSFIPTPVDIVL